MSNIITKNLNKIIMTYICGREREKKLLIIIIKLLFQ